MHLSSARRGSLATFNTVYDVMAEQDCQPPPESDSACWAVASLVGVTGAILVAVALLVPTLPSGWRIALGVVGGTLLLAALNVPVILSAAANEAEAQRRVREWVQSGDYDVIEGEVDSYKSKIVAATVEGCLFRVAGVTFSGHPNRFPGFEKGPHVRVTHHAGVILKLEVRAEGSGAQGG